MILSALSQIANVATALDLTDTGPNESVSARAHIDGKTDPKWARRRDRIDWVLAWYEADHCQRAWQQEVDAARKTLDRAGATPSQQGRHD